MSNQTILTLFDASPSSSRVGSPPPSAADAPLPPPSAVAAAAAGGGDAWRHSSGLLLPRGCVVQGRLSDDELLELEARSEARGARVSGAAARCVKRSLADEQQLSAFCEWLQDNGLDIFGSVTYSDGYAEGHSIYSLNRGLDDVWRGLVDFGFRYKFVLAGEWHPSGRLVPHLHLAMESAGHPVDKTCKDLWRYFYGSRGRCRFEPMRDQNTATLYALKDSIKASARDADSVRFRLWRPKRVK